VTQAVAINGYSPNKELAEQFAAYLTTEYTTLLYEKSGRVASYQFVNQNDKILNVYRAQYESSISLPKMVETGNYWLQLEVLFSKVWNGGDVTKLVDEMSERIHSQLTATN
jgi:maltose-binding protein MalE